MAVLVEVKEANMEKVAESGGANEANAKGETAETTGGLARQNWKKLFAVRKFLSLAQYQSKAAPAELLVANRYLVGKKIANGAFGQLRMGKDIESGHQVAIKLEPVNARIPMLFLEHRFYKALDHGRVGVPKVYHFGTCGGKYNSLVMELLGPNLEELFNKMGRKFSVKTILLIAIQLLSRIEHIHKKNLIYRDIKPENCLVGRFSKNSSHIIHIVDFGLAKQFIDPETGRHIDYSENKNLTGTVRYMSINAHQGKEQSRRDDLEALGYVFYYFLSLGNLPWQGVKCDDNRKRYQIIGKIKEQTEVADLARQHPWEFGVYLRYCRTLRFTQNPDYNYLKSLFRGCLSRHGWEEDYEFDWSKQKSKLNLYSVQNSPTIEIKPTVDKSPATKVREFKKTLEVDDYHNHCEEANSKHLKSRYCKSLPSSLRNSQEDLNKGSVDSKQNSQQQQNKNKTLTCVEAIELAIQMEIEAEAKENNLQEQQQQQQQQLTAELQQANIVIPEVKVSPANSGTGRQQPMPCQHFGNQLTVPLKGQKVKKEVKNEDSYGTTTLLVNPVNKRSASDVAKRSSIVKFTSCCPFVQIIKRSF